MNCGRKTRTSIIIDTGVASPDDCVQGIVISINYHPTASREKGGGSGNERTRLRLHNHLILSSSSFCGRHRVTASRMYKLYKGLFPSK